MKTYSRIRVHEQRKKERKKKDIPSIFKDESAGSCKCLWKLAVAVATYVSICIVYRILPSFAF
jgi:DNA invertase Pin-like site-specific DNA recombinase